MSRYQIRAPRWLALLVPVALALAPRLSAAQSPSASDTSTVAPADTSSTAAPAETPSTAAPADTPSTAAPADTPSTAAPADTFRAQEPPVSVEGVTEPVPHGRVTSHLRRTGEELDRFEFGACMPEGYFDVLGTIGYRRFMREGGPFEQSMTLDFAGGRKDYLTEGSMSLQYLFRPLKSYRMEWSIRPLLEVGPGLHLVVQNADVEGFSDSAFHAELLMKTHGYAGLELLLSRKAGILIRGRATVPAHKPLDYAQAAIFLR